MQKNGKRTFLVIVMIILICFSGFAQGGNESASKKSPYKLVIACRTFGVTPTDIPLVEAAISEITREKIDAEVSLLLIPSANYAQQMTLMLSGNEQIDAMGATRPVFMSAYSSDQLNPLDDLLKEYGQGIIKAIDPKYFSVGKYDGIQYGITTNRDQTRGYGGWLLKTEILEKYNIDASKIKTFEDLTKVFELVHEKEPNMTIVTPGTAQRSFLQWNVTFDDLSDYFGVLLDHGSSLKVENLFTSTEYMDYLKVVRDWYLKGFISKDIQSQSESGITLMKAGNLFAYCNSGKPGIEVQEEQSSGTDLTYVQVLPSFTSTSAPLTFQWTIPITSRNPGKAMQFLNLMYSDSDIMNLLAYGIEGKHWVEKGDGTITYPQGVNAMNSGYNLNMTWQFGNEFIAKVWDGNSTDIWKQTEEWNKTGIVSKGMGFIFNNSTVQNEISAVQNVYNQYRMAIECGVSDYRIDLPEMVKAMDAAGMQKIIAEKQKQLNAWAKANNVN